MDEKKLCKILYVDDEDSNIYLFRLAFGKQYNLITASSGDKGLEYIIADKGIDLVISDMKMPKMNGMEFIKEVKKIREDLPCAMLSGYEKNSEIDVELANGLLIDYIMKPFKKEQIYHLVELAVN